MAETGERAGREDAKAAMSRGATSLSDLGIPRDRASRAMQLADVPQDQFDAALAEPEVAQPRRILREVRAEREPPKPRRSCRSTRRYRCGGRSRELGSEIESGGLPNLEHWRENLQPFQLDHLRRYVPQIIEYLFAIQQEL